MPSSFSYRDLKPWGSHPLLDPLWSSTATEVVYDGARRSRSEKIECLAQDAGLLAQLQVCWNSQVENCGHCSKCSRTMLVLHTLGVEGAPFPEAVSSSLIADLQLKTDLGASFAVDLIGFFRRRGRPDLAAKVASRLRAFRLRQHARRLARDMVGSRTIGWLRRRLRPGEEVKTIRVVDPDDPL